RNFVRGIPVFATLLAIESGGEVVAGVASAPALGARWHAARGSGAFRDRQRMMVSRIASLERATLFHGNLGSGEGGPPPGIAGLIARVERTRGFRSEERRVGKEGRVRWWPGHEREHSGRG